ncbi:MAG: energy-coupling factor transporter ATPase [Lachnospiraceae bacterium]|jgi:energy-coupling factor transport system ATP-binding protein|nr:energy-coupling factor transporter ATPase [Lachnospiraceae bacterium]
MSFIKAMKLVHEYIHRDDDGNVDHIEKALDGVDLDIEAGDFIAILGHNGSGKSTLAKHMNAILNPSGGTLLVNGMDTADERNVWDIRKSAGMVFQNPDNQIIAGMVEEDVAFGPENLGVPTEEIWKRVADSLAAVHMERFRAYSPNRLSGGQKQRVAIAGVLAMQPDCIVLDEPTAMLDPAGRADVIRTIFELNRTKGVTVILITHYMEEVVNADKVFVMDKGKIVMKGTPRDIFSQVEALQRYQLDVPQITMLAHELKQAGVRIPDGILTREELTEALCHLS